MKLLVFAHKPPPHHGQSYMVQLVIEALGGDQRLPSEVSTRVPGAAKGDLPPIECYHVDCRLSDDLQDIGQARWGKLFRLLKYCLEAIWCRLRYGVHNFYYVPAPGLRSAIYRDWIVMLLCRPFFRRIVFHWQGVGLGEWLTIEAKPFQRWVTRRLLGHADLSIVLGRFYQADAAKLDPKLIEVIPNGIPDPCPLFDQEVLPRRSERAAARMRLLAGQPIAAADLKSSGSQKFRVLYLSLCTREKGLFDAVEAVALANLQLAAIKSPLRMHLTVAGKFWRDWEQKEFEQRIAQPDLNGDGSQTGEKCVVSFRGFVSGKEKHQLFRESDCFCFPTYYPIEGHPISLLEAMAYNLPIIATRWRAVPELFPAGYPGLVEPRSPDQVARVLHHFIGQGEDTSFRQAFLDKFTQARFAELLKTVLQICE